MGSVWSTVKDLALDAGPAVLDVLLLLVIAAAFWIVGSFLIKQAMKLLEKALTLNKSVEPTVRRFLLALANGGMKFLLAIIVMGQLNIETTQFVAIIGAAVFAIAFAMEGTMANFAAGVILISFKPIRMGDLVAAGDAAGFVKKISLFNTILTTERGQNVLVPNNSVTSSAIVNLSARKHIRLELEFAVERESDWEAVRDLLLDVLEGEPTVFDEPEPDTVIKYFDEDNVYIVARAWVSPGDLRDLRHSILELIYGAFENSDLSLAHVLESDSEDNEKDFETRMRELEQKEEDEIKNFVPELPDDLPYRPPNRKKVN